MIHIARMPLDRRHFDAACRRLEAALSGYGPSCTSGRRSLKRNEAVGAKGDSHVQGLGRDYVFDEFPPEGDLYLVCKALGLWAQIHDAGSGKHLHVQGTPPA